MTKYKRLIYFAIALFGILVMSLPFCLTPNIEDEGVKDTSQIVYAQDAVSSNAPSSSKGGHLYIGIDSTYIMSIGKVSGGINVYGGAVYIASGATFTMTGGEIVNCQAKYGGAIYVASGGTCNIHGGSITNNSAEYAPAIYVEDGGTLNISDTAIISDNTLITYTITINFYIDDALSSSININKDSYYSDIELPLSNSECIGWYLDSAYTSPMPATSKLPKNKASINLYTMEATLDKLSFTLDSTQEEYSVSKASDSISGTVVIPREHDGKVLTSIASSGFSNCTTVTNVVIPESVTTISSLAFQGCSGLTGVKFINVSMTEVENLVGTSGKVFSVTVTLTCKDGNYTYTGEVDDSSCFAEGTLVTLADGSQKKIEDLQYDDLLLIWNFYLGCFDYQYPLVITNQGTAGGYTLVTFDDGTELKLVNGHQIFNMDILQFVSNSNEDNCYVGAKFAKQVYVDGEPALKEVTIVSIETIETEVNYYNLITSYHWNYFIEGVLSSTSFSNACDIDESLLYDQQQLNLILNMGEEYQFKYEEFADIVPYYMFEGMMVNLMKEVVYLSQLEGYNGPKFTLEEIENKIRTYVNTKLRHLKTPETVEIDGQTHNVWYVSTSNDPYNYVKVVEGQTYTLEEAEVIEGKTFVGWYDLKTGTYLQAGDSVVINCSTFLRAVYE